jgi:hypothetical protein
MPLAGKVLKSTIFVEFRPPIQPRAFRARFWGSSPMVFQRALIEAGHCVPKTLELGTTVGRAGIHGKMRKSMFLKCVLKPVFRFGPERGFPE